MQGPLIEISSRQPKARVIIGLAIVGAIVFAWFAVRWQLGTMLAELTTSTDPAARYSARQVRSLAPGDPLAAWLEADVEKSYVTQGGWETAAQMFATAVRLGPADYRWWIELGRYDGQTGRSELAEPAFRQAISLAPAYAYPRWQYGNFLLRSNRPDEAFVELRKSAEDNLAYREQVFSLAWDYFQHDPARVEALVGNAPEVQASLALFYAAHRLPADSLRIWNSLSDSEKARHPQTVRIIAASPD